MTQIIKRWFGDTQGRCSFGLGAYSALSIDIVQLDDGSMGVTNHNTDIFLEGPTATWSAMCVIAEVLSGLWGPPDVEVNAVPSVEWWGNENKVLTSKQVWYCESPACKHREVDVGHTCYWCGGKQK